jgi:uncharacterized protein YdaU (DUF1376 family)
MAKDPAVLFYTSDFLVGTMTMSNEHTGVYIKLLCIQHQKGRLSKEDIAAVCGCHMDAHMETHMAPLISKFIKDEHGFYYNKRMEEEAKKRQAFVASRLKNLHTSSHMEAHMGDHMENVNENININNAFSNNNNNNNNKAKLMHIQAIVETTTTIISGKSQLQYFEELWKKYPRRIGKKEALRHFRASVKTPEDLSKIEQALANYLQSTNVAKGFVQNGSTWFNNWTDWAEYTDCVCDKCGGRGRYVSNRGYEITCDCNAGNRIKKPKVLEEQY